MDRENSIDQQSLAAFAPGGPETGFHLHDTHAAGRLQFPADGGRPTLELLAQLSRAIPRWSKEAITYCVVMEGGDPFCAGWDMGQLLQGDPEVARRCLAQSYAMAWQLECFTKPGVSLIDGAVAGAGAAFTIYGTHRVAGAGARIAFAGPHVGWFPDHGLSHVLAHLPGAVGTYLALTGASIEPADAYRLGLVTHCINAGAFAGIAGRLSDADPVDPILDGLHERPADGELAARAEVIDHSFSADSIAVIQDRLAAVTGAHEGWAKAAREAIAAAPPFLTALTLKLLRENRHCDLREALIRDYRVAVRLLSGAGRSAADPQMLAGMLASLGSDDLKLPTRAEMQAPAL